MSLAYLIRAHHRPTQLVRLVDRLTTPNASFFIHVSSRTLRETYDTMREGLAGRDDVHWVPRIPAYYAGFSLVKSTLAGLNEVVQDGLPPHTVLLSGQDYPLRPAAEIERFIAERPGRSLIEHFPIPSARWAEEDGGLRRIRYRHFERIHFRTRLLRIPALRRSFPAGLEPWGGSAWGVLSDEAVRTVLAFREERPDAHRFFKRVMIPDEIYLQTVLANSPLRERLVNEAVHHIEWIGGSHPRTFVSGDFERLAGSGMPFARKFDVDVDEEILDVIDRELLSQKNEPAVTG